MHKKITLTKAAPVWYRRTSMLGEHSQLSPESQDSAPRHHTLDAVLQICIEVESCEYYKVKAGRI